MRIEKQRVVDKMRVLGSNPGYSIRRSEGVLAAVFCGLLICPAVQAEMADGTRRAGCSNGRWDLGTEVFLTSSVVTHDGVENWLRQGRKVAQIRGNVLCDTVFVPELSHGRLRPFPRSGIRPGIHAGLREQAEWYMVGWRRCVSRVHAAPAFATRSPLKRADDQDAHCGEKPGVNAGPKTGCAGKRA
jgi:hypothetical protein